MKRLRISRTTLACAVAPLVGPLVCSLYITFSSSGQDRRWLQPDLLGLAMFPVFAFSAYALFAVVGLPALKVLEKLTGKPLIAAPLSGIICACVLSGGLMSLSGHALQNAHELLVLGCVFVPLGTTSGIVFKLIQGDDRL